MDATELAQLKKKVEKLNRKADEAEGARKQLMVELQKEFSCKNLAEAETELAKQEKEEAELERECQKKLTAFEKQYSEQLKD